MPTSTFAFGPGLEAAAVTILVMIVVFVPGYCFTGILMPHQTDHNVILSYSLGLGVVLPGLVLLWARVIGLRMLSAPVIAGYCAVSLCLLLWLLRRRSIRPRLPTATEALFLVVFLVALVDRLGAVLDLRFGHLGDSLQHTIIVQLLVERGGLFNDWAPYGAMTSFSYHFGFHAIAAMAQVLTGIATERCVVLVGQVMNALVVPATYLGTALLFADKAYKHPSWRWAGALAALVPAFLNTQPAYYVNWGRYTQLTGQVVLPLVGPLLLRQVVGQSRSRRTQWAFGLLLGGLFLTHYRISLIAITFIATSLILLWVSSSGNWRQSLRESRTLVFVGLLSFVLVLPWLVQVWGGKLPTIYGRVLPQTGEAIPAAAMELPRIAPFYLKWWIAALAGVGLLTGIRGRTWETIHPAGWFIAMLAFPTLFLWSLPGARLIDWMTIYIALYIPTTYLFGYAGSWLLAKLAAWSRRLEYVATVVGVLTICAWGFNFQLNILSPDTGRLVNHDDELAFDWIKQNTPPEGQFLVGGFPCFGGLVCGNDAGWWLTYATMRHSSLSPLPYATEATEPITYKANLQSLYGALRSFPTSDDRTVVIDLTTPGKIALLRQNKIGYIFIGGSRFPVASDRFDTAAMLRSPDFRLVFSQGDTRIFELRSEP
ncbi:MAG: hypothetical protein K1X39_06870 [Thermoflexales bacterium]|nr:hypothetical protein [Thermoflexales bacterium]